MKNKITINPKKMLMALIVAAAVIGLFFILPLLNGALKESAQAADAPSGWHGDVDNDGEVTAADARLTLRAAVALEDYKMIVLINALETSADSIFCDGIDYSAGYRSSILSEMIGNLPVKEQKRILDTVEFLIRQAQEQ